MRWVDDVSECIHGESTHLIHTHHAIVSTHIHTHTALHRQRPDTNPVFLNTTHQRQTTSAEEEPLLCAGRSRARPVHYTDLQRRALQQRSVSERRHEVCRRRLSSSSLHPHARQWDVRRPWRPTLVSRSRTRHAEASADAWCGADDRRAGRCDDGGRAAALASGSTRARACGERVFPRRVREFGGDLRRLAVGVRA